MSRFFGRRLACDLAVTLLVVFTAVSVVDIDDYDMHSRATLADSDRSGPSAATPETFQEAEDPGSEPGHHCACLLCAMTIPDTFEPRIAPPSPGKMPSPLDGGVLRSPHSPEIFHPPSA